MNMMILILKILGMGCLILIAAIALIVLIACLAAVVKGLFTRK